MICLLFQAGDGHNWLRWTTLGIFVAMAVSDLLDGYLARRLNQESALGRVLDPIADKLLVTSAFLLLWLLGVRTPEGVTPTQNLHLPGWVVAVALGKDLLILVGNLVSWIRSIRIRVQARPIGKWCTTAQLVMVLAMLLWPSWPTAMADVTVVLWWTASALACAAAVDYTILGLRAIGWMAPGSDVE